MDDDREYHIAIASGEMPELVMLPGDPGRARLIAEQFFENPVEVAKNREYWSYKGTYKGVEVGVCSTGIGCPSAAIAIEELVKVGCKVFVRVGTAGAIDPRLEAGDIVIFTGAVRDDGTSRQYVPLEFPAVADPHLVAALTEAAAAVDVNYYVGIGHSKDSFYSEFPEMTADPDSTSAKWEAMRKAGVLATEMEAASLFIIGHLRGVQVGSICVIVGENIEKEAKIVGKPPLDNLVTIALDAMTGLRKK
jgi:uridine phosphorylase